MINYEIIEDNMGKIVKPSYEDATVWWIPTDPANSDYQAYLEHLTENPTEDVE